MEINLCTMPLQAPPGNWHESTENFLYLLHRKCGKKQAHHLEKSSGIAPKNV